MKPYLLNRIETRLFKAGAVVMYDSTDAYAIPADAALVAGYVDGYASYNSMVSRFGKSKVVSITIHGNDADVADVESGAMSADQLPGWVARQKARGVARPVVYSSGYDYPTCVDYVGDMVDYWTADPVGYPITLLGRSAVQYKWTTGWDASWVLPSFPFYPGAKPNPNAPPSAYPVLREGMSGPYVAKVQQLLNRHREVVKPVLTVDGGFGPKTKAGVEEWQSFKKLQKDGVVGVATWGSLLVKPKK